MPVPPFKLTDQTRDRLLAAMDGLPPAQRGQIVAALADLSAEVEIHCRKKFAEDLRQQWASSLATMLMKV